MLDERSESPRLESPQTGFPSIEAENDANSPKMIAGGSRVSPSGRMQIVPEMAYLRVNQGRY